jgi:hypothetical protein
MAFTLTIDAIACILAGQNQVTLLFFGQITSHYRASLKAVRLSKQ